MKILIIVLRIWKHIYMLFRKVTVLSWGIEDDYEYNVGNIREYHYKSSNDKLTQNSNVNFIRKFASSIGLGQVHTIRHKGLDIGHRANFLKNDYDIVMHNGPDSNNLANYIGNKFHIPKMERLDWVGLPYRSSYYKEWLLVISSLDLELSQRKHE